MRYELSDVDIAKHDRFFCYLWTYDGWVHLMCKFGDVWVVAGEDAVAECRNRVRQSAGVLKHEFDQGKVKIVAIWDVSFVARKFGKFKEHGKIDTTIGDHIGFRIKDDLYELDAESMMIKIDAFLKKIGQPLVACGLSMWQYRGVDETCLSFENGSTTILADFCARAGKTLYIGAVIRETDTPITVYASYVLTTFTSVIGDLGSFEQFRNVELIDSKDTDYRERVALARKAGKQVVVFLSLCKGGLKKSKRDERIKFLFGLDERVLLVVDEADYGAWKPGQCDELVKWRRPTDRVILMTGTNSDRAIGGWDVDDVLQITYLEMLMEKKVPTSYPVSPRISNFKIDRTRHDLVVDVAFYQMDLAGVVEAARKLEPELFVEDGIFLPSWSKFAKSPLKAKGFFTRMLRAIFDDYGNHGELNFDLQKGGVKDSGVYMMFLPANMRCRMSDNKLAEAVLIAENALGPKWVVIALANSFGAKNKTAQLKVKNAVELALKAGKHVLILSTMLAQRSFSVGEIEAVFLAYDNGEAGATIQKISRGLTPHEIGKLGRIISLSFDPHRDDKLDSLILQTAVNYKKSHNVPSVKIALELVLKTVDIFNCTENGSVKIKVDDYLNEIVNQVRISRVVGRMAYVDRIGDHLRECLLNSNFNRFTPETDSSQMGKAMAKKAKRMTSKQKAKKRAEDADLREKIIALCENLDVVVFGSGATNMKDALVIMGKSKTLQTDFENESGIPYSALVELVESGAINLNLIELVRY